MTAALRGAASLQVSTGETIAIPMPPMVEGDHIYALVVAYSTFADTLSAADPWPNVDGWEVSANVDIIESATVVGHYGVYTTVATSASVVGPVIDNPVNSNSKLGVATAISVGGAGGTPGVDAQILGPFNTADTDVPAVPILQPDSIVGLGMVSVGQWLSAPTVNTPYIKIGAQRTTVLYGAEAHLWQTKSVSLNVGTTETDINVPQLLTGGSGWYAMAVMPVTPKPLQVKLPAQAEPARLELGYADDYRAYITGPDYETVIAEIGWSDLEWNRVLDEPSTANVSVPDRYAGVSCVASLGGLVPWRYGLKIERNDFSVWKGVVTTIQRSPNAVRVTASDIFSRFQKRLATRQDTINFTDADAGTAFAAIVLASQIDGEAWSLRPPEVQTLKAFTRQIAPVDLDMAWDLMEDLADASIDIWIGDGVLYAFQPGTGWMYWDGFATSLLPGPYDSTGELVYGVFTERNYTDMPLWSINGWAQANTGWVPAPDAGEDGTRQIWSAVYGPSVIEDGVLDIVEQNDLYKPDEEQTDLPDDVFQRFADSLVAQRSISPAVMEGGTLAANAPIDVVNLRPGSIWLIDIWDAGYGQLLQRSRLKRVTVSVTKGGDGETTEAVKPVLYPVGYEE